MKHGFNAAVAAIIVCAAPAAALDFFNDDVSIGGKLCVGEECTSNEP